VFLRSDPAGALWRGGCRGPRGSSRSACHAAERSHREANHLGRRMGGGWRASDVAQQGRRRRRHTQALDQSGSGLPAQCEAHQFQDLVQAGRLTSVGFDEVGQALGEDPALASRLWTAELPNVQEQPHAATTPRTFSTLHSTETG
jgi:hypothetical protein